MKAFRILWLVCLLAAGAASYAQVRIVVTKTPGLLIPDAGLFLASNLNSWDPGDPGYALTENADGTYYIDLPDTLKHFRYKITQGTWTAVEGSADGKKLRDRIYDRDREVNPKLVRISLAGWEQSMAFRFLITRIPQNTPHDATLYLTGTFNNWNPRDERYKLTRQHNGTYRVKVYSDLGKLEYKVTRGTWESIESRENSRARANRVITRADKVGIDGVELTVEGWEDLPRSFNTLSLYDVLLLCSAINGLLLVIVITTIENFNRKANSWLVILLLMTSGFITARVLCANKEIVQFFPKIQLIPNFILFTYAPIFYFYVRKLLFNEEDIARGWRWHFIFFVLQILAYVPFLVMDNNVIAIEIMNQTVRVQTLFAVVGMIGLCVNAWYWFNLRKIIIIYKRESQSSYSYEENLHYLNSVMFIKAACLLLWLFTVLMFVYGWFFSLDVYSTAEKCIDGIWLMFSTTSYLLGYFAIYQPEIFKLTSTALILANEPVQAGEIREEPDGEKRNEDSIDEALLLQLKEKLEAYMQRHKPFTNPQLALNELAIKLKMQPYLLSRVINEGYNQNFFYFINTYRIEEFKKRLEDPSYKKYTLLAIAFEVGFNSKTAFNRSFKRVTNLSPREYFSSTKSGINHLAITEDLHNEI